MDIVVEEDLNRVIDESIRSFQFKLQRGVGCVCKIYPDPIFNGMI